MPTPEEVEDLKRDWLSDPCWDIETTDGFEEHRAYLRAFRLHQEERWRDDEHRRLVKYAAQMGVQNLALAGYIRRLELRLAVLEDRVAQAVPL